MLLIIVFLNCLFSVTAQTKLDSLKITSNGVFPSEGIKIKTTINSTYSYNRTLSWVNENYENPENVITGKQENKSLTIRGLKKSAYHKNIIGIEYYYDMSYHIYFQFLDSIIIYKIQIDNFYFKDSHGMTNTKEPDFKYWFKNNNEIRDGYLKSKESLESSINENLYSYYNKILNNNTPTESEAISELKKYKEKLELNLITQSEYDIKKEELSKFIK